MPEDVDAVIAELFAGRRDEEPPRRTRSMQQLDRGVVALDYGDDDHVFRLAVERIPRERWKPETSVRIGHVDGVDVDLVGVTVDNFVHVWLTAPPSDERTRLTRLYDDAFERWAATAKERQADPPDQPAHRLLRIATTIRDSLETRYGLHTGQAGGTGTEWMATQSFRPRPPAEVRELHLTLQAPGQPVVPVLVAW